jgi:hypothetical protein
LVVVETFGLQKMFKVVSIHVEAHADGMVLQPVSSSTLWTLQYIYQYMYLQSFGFIGKLLCDL